MDCSMQAFLSITKSGVCSNPCPLSQWCHPTNLSSFIPFYSCLQSFPASGFFSMSQFFTDAFLELQTFSQILLLFLWSSGLLAIWSQIPLPFLNPAWTSGNSVYILFKNNLENFEHYFAIMWDECNCAVVWTFFGIAFLWDWNENWPFLVWWPLLSFPTLLTYWVQHFYSILF